MEFLGCRGAPFHHPYLREASCCVANLVEFREPLNFKSNIMPSDFPWQVILMGPENWTEWLNQLKIYARSEERRVGKEC